MSSTPDEITIEYEESGQILIKELDKVILSKGAWTTILFRYQELDAETGGYGQDKYAIRRYQKSGGEYNLLPCGRLVFSHRDAVYGWGHACA